MVDFCVETIGRKTSHRTRNELQTASAVHRVLVLGQNNKCGTGLVETRVHTRGYLFATGERETNVDTVLHAVGLECAAYLFYEPLVGWNSREPKCRGTGAQPVEMFNKPEDTTLVETQPFPHRVTPLDHTVKRADAGLVTVD